MSAGGMVRRFDRGEGSTAAIVKNSSRNEPGGAIDQPSNADATAQLLRALDLSEGLVGKRELSELNDVLTTDYLTARALPAPETARYLDGIVNTTLDLRHPLWKKWQHAGNVRVRLPDFHSQDIVVRTAPYTRGAGLLLWGFSCDMRIGNRGSFVIFLNTAHQPGAITTTAAHELGHYIHRRIESTGSHAMAALSANFVTHLSDKAELFSDSVVALSAYGADKIRQIRGWHNGSPGAADWRGEIARAGDLISPDYRMDFGRKTMSPEWRVRYLAATIHFFKLRRALLETAGI
jgi:hypothetical protein